MKTSRLISLALLLILQTVVTCVFAQDYDGREYFCIRETWNKPDSPKEGEIIPPIYNILVDDYICGYTVNGMWDFYPYGLYLMHDGDGYMMVLKYYSDDDHVQSDTIRIDSKLASRLNVSVKKTLKSAVKNTTIPWSEMGNVTVNVFTTKKAAYRTIDQIPDSLWLEQYLKFNHTPLRPSWAPKPISDEEMEEFLRQGGQIIEMDTTWFYLVPAGAQQSNNMENGHEYVDLGLSVKWAEYNVGADKPEDYGDYFAWGETDDEKKDEYWWTSYKYCNGSNKSLTKYCYDSRYGLNGFVDNKTVLEPDDDVAHVIWGGKWRMPTVDEFNELIDSCTWTWTNRNGVNGYIVTSNMPGYTDRSIFLPACGYYWYSELNRADSASFYWSGSLDDHWPYDASILFFEENRHITFVDDRYSGIPVRPVCPK